MTTQEYALLKSTVHAVEELATTLLKLGQTVRLVAERVDLVEAKLDDHLAHRLRLR